MPQLDRGLRIVGIFGIEAGNESMADDRRTTVRALVVGVDRGSQGEVNRIARMPLSINCERVTYHVWRACPVKS